MSNGGYCTVACQLAMSLYPRPSDLLHTVYVSFHSFLNNITCMFESTKPQLSFRHALTQAYVSQTADFCFHMDILCS